MLTAGTPTWIFFKFLGWEKTGGIEKKKNTNNSRGANNRRLVIDGPS